MAIEFIYVMDPMCSWCYAFHPVLNQIVADMPEDTSLYYVMGGLAPDSDVPMPAQTRAYVQQAWQAISQRTGIEFNFDFWEKCTPRRSTYPACRAVIAAGLQGDEYRPLMVSAIQKAYYTQARNPSDHSTLIELAEEIGLDQARFSDELNSSPVQHQLQQDFVLRDRLSVQGFPALIAKKDEAYYAVTYGYIQLEVVQDRLKQIGVLN